MENLYYEWANDFEYQVPDKIIIPEEWNAYSLFLGNKINKKLGPIKVFFQNDKRLSDSIPNAELLLFFNKRMADFMNKCYSKKLFQAFPVEIKGEKKVNDTYFLINVLNIKNVIDKEKSDLTTDRYGEINRIKRLVIKKENFKDNDFFRLEGDWTLLICSQAFVDKINKMGFKGMKFIPIGKKRI